MPLLLGGPGQLDAFSPAYGPNDGHSHPAARAGNRTPDHDTSVPYISPFKDKDIYYKSALK
jgi:hypothetical protein